MLLFIYPPPPSQKNQKLKEESKRRLMQFTLIGQVLVFCRLTARLTPKSQIKSAPQSHIRVNRPARLSVSAQMCSGLRAVENFYSVMSSLVGYLHEHLQTPWGYQFFPMFVLSDQP